MNVYYGVLNEPFKCYNLLFFNQQAQAGEIKKLLTEDEKKMKSDSSSDEDAKKKATSDHKQRTTKKRKRKHKNNKMNIEDEVGDEVADNEEKEMGQKYV